MSRCHPWPGMQVSLAWHASLVDTTEHACSTCQSTPQQNGCSSDASQCSAACPLHVQEHASNYRALRSGVAEVSAWRERPRLREMVVVREDLRRISFFRRRMSKYSLSRYSLMENCTPQLESQLASHTRPSCKDGLDSMHAKAWQTKIAAASSRMAAVRKPVRLQSLQGWGSVTRDLTLTLSSTEMETGPAALGSSAALWNWATYGCCKASSAVNLHPQTQDTLLGRVAWSEIWKASALLPSCTWPGFQVLRGSLCMPQQYRPRCE